MGFKRLLQLSLACLTLNIASLANAQAAQTYLDPVSGITFQRLTTTYAGFSFGVALPEVPSDEFIGQLTGLVGKGWAGISFGGGMDYNLLLVAWPNGQNIVSDFRMTPYFNSPSLYTHPTHKPLLTPLPCATSVNATHWTLTFTCQNCHYWTEPVGNTPGGFDIAGPFVVMGWAAADYLPFFVGTKGSPLSQHQQSGQFGVSLEQARGGEYEALKGRCLGGTTTTGTPPVITSTTTTSTSTTTPVPPTTTTTTAEPPTTTSTTSSPTTTIPTTTTLPPTTTTTTTTEPPTTTSPTTTPTTSTSSPTTETWPPTTTSTSTTTTTSTTEPIPPSSTTPTWTPTDTPTWTPTDTPTPTPTIPSLPPKKQWEQCGGIWYTGSKECESPHKCVEYNPYYGQCV